MLIFDNSWVNLVSINLCFTAFIIFSLVSIVSLFRLVAKVPDGSSCKRIVRGSVVSILLFASNVILFFFLSNFFLLLLGFIAILVLNLISLIKGASLYMKEVSIRDGKYVELEKEIETLKAKPNLELEFEQRLLTIPKKWLEKMVTLYEKPNSFETELLPFMFATLGDILHFDGAVFFIADAFDDSLSCKMYVGNFPPPYRLPEDVPHKEEIVRTNFKHYECHVGETLFGKVAEDGKPYYSSSYTDDGVVFQNGDEAFLKIGSIIALPLFTNGCVSAVFAISRDAGKEAFSEKDFRVVSNFAGYFSSILSLVILLRDYRDVMLLNKTSSMAQEFRDLLLPKKIKTASSLDIDFFFRRQQSVCSDYYDVLQHKDRTFIIMVDVAGKSQQAVIVMIMIRAILHLVTNTDQSLASIMDWLNKGISGKMASDHFATVSLLAYYPVSRRLEVSIAGNQSMIWHKANKKETEIFEYKTDPIGIDVHSQYKSLNYDLDKGDVISLCTDGISQMLDKNGKLFDVSSLAKVIAKNAGEVAKKIKEASCTLIDQFSENTFLSDDQTLVIMKIK